MKKLIEKIFKINKKILAGLGIIILLTVFLFFKKTSQKKESYQIAEATKETLIESISASGQIINSSSQIVYTQASGLVKAVYVKNDQLVKKGDKILEVELDQQGQQRYQQALANYLSAKNSLETAQINLNTLQAEMFDKWETFYNLATSSTYQNADGTPNETNRQLPEFLIAKNNWLAAEAKYKNQQNQIAQAQSSLASAWLSYQLSSPTVLAVADGKITDLIYETGMMIGSSGNSETSSANTKIATIKNDSLPFGRFTVSEIDVSKIKPGQKVTITIDALLEKTYTGEVIAIDKTGEVSSSVVSYPLTIKFDTQATEILPNMSATAKIIVNKKTNVLTVPSSAVIKQDESHYVRILKNKKITIVPVEIGISSETKTEIVSGLSEGEKVVVLINSTSTTGSQSPFSGFGFGGGTRIRMR
ncbi:MAG: efflux RND transporter periplasmic adaptor subunit [Patescibacteria group bacterium]|nr:efflux RND transporter periplasmic adaptor subunit [Patescibacteria group bacterium]